MRVEAGESWTENNLVFSNATAAFTLDVYGHVTAQMRRDSASRMKQFIQSVSTG